MKLIFENDSKLSYSVFEELNEGSGISEKKYRIKGIFSTIGEKNRNGRIYPRNIWETEVAKYQSNFEKGSLNLLCEWQHPPRSKVDPMEAVAKIEKLTIDGKYVMGEAVLLDNPKANQLKSLIEAGIKLSVSSRGVGNVKNGIVENFNLITYDLVDEPSDYAATMNGMVESFVLTEGIIEEKNFEVTEGGSIIEVAMCTDNACHLFESTDISNGIIEKFKLFLNEIKTNIVSLEDSAKQSKETKKKSAEELSLELKALKDPSSELSKSLANFNDRIVNAKFSFQNIDTKQVQYIEKKFKSYKDAISYAVIMGYDLESCDGDGEEKISEMQTMNIKQLPKFSTAKSPKLMLKATFTFKDDKTAKKRTETLYFNSLDDAKKYADIKNRSLDSSKDLSEE